MKIRVCGTEGPVAAALRDELKRRGHTVADQPLLDERLGAWLGHAS